MVIALCREELHHVITGASTVCFNIVQLPRGIFERHFIYL